jgi:hypothetical protein
LRVTINMDDSLYLELLDLSKTMNRSLSGQVVHLVKTHGELLGKRAVDKRPPGPPDGPRIPPMPVG